MSRQLGVFPRNTERRFLPTAVSLRAATGNSPGTITGYAVKWNSLSEPLGDFRERVLPNAFTKSLADGDDVKALVNHDPNRIIGRRRAGTLRLRQDPVGLYFECDVAPTSVGRDLVTNIRNGLIDQCSFAFVANEQDWGEVKDPTTCEMVPLRSIRAAKLLDVSCVVDPAYTSTSVGVASVRDGDFHGEAGSQEHIDYVSDPDSDGYDQNDPDFDPDWSDEAEASAAPFFNSTRTLWPAGIPVEVRSHVPLVGQRRRSRTSRTGRQDFVRRIIGS